MGVIIRRAGGIVKGADLLCKLFQIEDLREGERLRCLGINGHDLHMVGVVFLFQRSLKGFYSAFLQRFLSAGKHFIVGVIERVEYLDRLCIFREFHGEGVVIVCFGQCDRGSCILVAIPGGGVIALPQRRCPTGFSGDVVEGCILGKYGFRS